MNATLQAAGILLESMVKTGGKLVEWGAVENVQALVYLEEKGFVRRVARGAWSSMHDFVITAEGREAVKYFKRV